MVITNLSIRSRRFMINACGGFFALAALQLVFFLAPVVAEETTAADTAINDPEDIAFVKNAFEDWASSVIAKERDEVVDFHADDFGVLSGAGMLNKDDHVILQLTVDNKQMDLLELSEVRRTGNLYLVWSTHFIRADKVPPIPSIGLEGDWGGEEQAKVGFVQKEFTVWRRTGDKLRCVAFHARRVG